MEQGVTLHEWKVGQRVQVKGSRPWTDEEGKTRFDRYLVEGRISKIEGAVAFWARERVVTVEKNCPGVELDALLPESGGFRMDVADRLNITYLEGERYVPQQWEREHGADYEVPEQVLEQVRLGNLEDTSWHNDTSPSFTTKGGDFVLWVEHPQQSKRESEEYSRFVVCLNTYKDGNDRLDYTEYYAGEDLAEALQRIATLEAVGIEGLRTAADMHHEVTVSTPPGDEL